MVKDPRVKPFHETQTEMLGKIASALTRARFGGKGLPESLELICRSLVAEAAALCRIKPYGPDGHQDGHQIDPVSSWSSPCLPPLALDSAPIPDTAWSALLQRKIAPWRAPSRQESGSSPWLFLLPIFLEERLCSVLALSGLDRNGLGPQVEAFLRALIPVLELWLNRENAAKRCDDLIAFMPLPTFILKMDGLITDWNPAVEKLTGWNAGRIVGKGNYAHALPFYSKRRPSCSDLILRPDPEWESTYMDFRREGDNIFVLAYCPSLPGGGAYLTGKTSRLYDIDGRLYGSIHTVRDVTRERQIEKSLHQSQSIYRAITDFARFGIVFLDQNDIHYSNEYFSELIGISERKITLDDLRNWICPGDRETVLKNFDDLFRNRGGPSRFEFSASRGESLRHYSVYAQMLDYEGQPAICFVLDDTTEQKELARKARLNELKLYHEGRLTSLGIMAAGIAHELNQPLNTIRVVTDGFLFGRDSGWELDLEELYDGLEMVSSQVVRMSGVIQNIRNFAREEPDPRLMEVDVNCAIDNVFSMMGRQFEAHGISVHKHLEYGLPTVYAILNRLEQVIMNLLVNARQALDECKQARKELWIRTEGGNGSVCIEVIDNGSGIPVNLLDKIFDPFFTTKEVGQGTGLGLTISQSIVREFKGTLGVLNNELGGATFFVHLPAAGEKR